MVLNICHIHASCTPNFAYKEYSHNLLFGTFFICQRLDILDLVCNFLPPSVNELKAHAATHFCWSCNQLFVYLSSAPPASSDHCFFETGASLHAADRSVELALSPQKIKVQMMEEERLRSAWKRADVGMLILSVMTLIGAEPHLISLSLSFYLWTTNYQSAPLMRCFIN